MTVLTGAEAAGLVESMTSSEVQTQMCGIELTLARIESFRSNGALAYENKERQLPDTEMLEFDESGWIMLQQGCYLVTFNEIVNIPKDIMALGRPRSSLLRSGATIETALWDPGYRGRSQSLLVVHNPYGLKLKRNARLMQLVFFRLGRETEKVYQGRYQGENI